MIYGVLVAPRSRRAGIGFGSSCTLRRSWQCRREMIVSEIPGEAAA